jgi:predicted 3-demethylubiquinone-9 3-methyltransferase (glyoxalase superfamily)
MQKITPFLWYNDNAHEAAKFYVSVFGDESQINKVNHYGDGEPGDDPRVMSVDFQLRGQAFIALNGGPQFRFTEAVSFFIDCDGQAEVDRLWDSLTADGGEEGMCGWLKDKYGLSWQIVPAGLNDMLVDEDAEKSKRVMDAMMKMKKIDIDELRRVAGGAS